MLRLSDVKRLYGRKVCVCGVCVAGGRCGLRVFDHPPDDSIFPGSLQEVHLAREMAETAARARAGCALSQANQIPSLHRYCNSLEMQQFTNIGLFPLLRPDLQHHSILMLMSTLAEKTSTSFRCALITPLCASGIIITVSCGSRLFGSWWSFLTTIPRVPVLLCSSSSVTCKDMLFSVLRLAARYLMVHECEKGVGESLTPCCTVPHFR